MQEVNFTPKQPSIPPPPTRWGTRYLCLKHLSVEALQKNGVITKAFEQWGVETVHMVMDPALEGPPYAGHAIVQMRDPEQVRRPPQCLCPRPRWVDSLSPAGAKGSKGVLSCRSLAWWARLLLCRQEPINCAILRLM